MIRILLFLVVVTALGLGFSWIADRPGVLAIDWLGMRVETGILTAIVLFIAAVLAIMLVWKIISTVFGAPKTMKSYFDSRRRDKGYDALSRGMVAIGAGDARGARRAVIEAEKFLSNEPMTLLLGAQAAQLGNDHATASRQFTLMLDSPRTRLLGLRGLYLEAMKAGNEDEARRLAEQAAAQAPGLGWAATALFEDQAMRRDWAAARASLKRNADLRITDKEHARRLRAVLLTAEALEREESEPDSARALAVEATKLAPGLAPAAAVAGRLLVRGNDIRKAAKILESAWRRSPHPDLAETYIHLRPGDGMEDRVRRARKLSQLVSHQREGELALAGALIDAGKPEEAREILKPFLDNGLSERICLMMAEIEEKLGGDTGLVRSWMARALRAERDPAWVADGVVSAEWQPLSPVTGQLDAFEWRVPMDRPQGTSVEIGRPTGPSILLGGAPVTVNPAAGAPDRVHETPLEEVALEEPEVLAPPLEPETGGEEAHEPIIETGPVIEADDPSPEASTASPAIEKQALPIDAREGDDTAYEPLRAPDDPGPLEGDDDGAPKPRRFRLF